MVGDINLFVEARSKEGIWESQDPWTKLSSRLQNRVKHPIYEGHNQVLYALFGNGLELIESISECKGPPDDLSPEVLQMLLLSIGSWGYSWLTLRELLEYDWTQKIKLSGLISATEYYRWKTFDPEHRESPQKFAGAAPTIVSEEELSILLDELKSKQPGKIFYQTFRDLISQTLSNVYCQVSWTEPLYRTCSDFWIEAIPRLLRFGNPDDVRIVFWFR